MTHDSAALELLMTKVLKMPGDGCWLWQGRLIKNGYGATKVAGGGTTTAHRAVYLASGHPIADDAHLHHLCGNKLCVRPSHLQPLSARDHVMTTGSVVAQNAVKTHCVRRHEFTPSNTLVRTDKYGYTRRLCRECRRNRRESSV
jgi:hypothetical protein